MLIIWPNFHYARLNFLCLVSAFRRMSFLISSKTISEKEIKENCINHTRSLHSSLFMSCCISKSAESKAKKVSLNCWALKISALRSSAAWDKKGYVGTRKGISGQERVYQDKKGYVISLLFLGIFVILTPDQLCVNRTKDSLLRQIKWLFTLSFFLRYQQHTHSFVGVFKQIFKGRSS